jgi:hypothetical protein
MPLIFDPGKKDSCLNSFREVFSDPLKSGDDNAYNAGIILPLNFTLEMDGISGLIPHSAFIIPSNSLPSSYKIKSGPDAGKQRIAFILHTIEQNFNSSKWTTKISGQTLNIRFEPLTEGEKINIQNAKAKQKSLKELANNINRREASNNKNNNRSKAQGTGTGYAYIRSKYGEIGPRLTENGGDGLVDKSLLTSLTFPYPMYNAYNGNLQKTAQCHVLVKDDLEAIFKEILDKFGLEQIKKLKLDKNGGIYVPRLKRGGSTASIHTWGIAIDISPADNPFKTRTGKALFSKPEYKEFIDIWYRHNFKSFGRELGYDWMHFQANDVIF